MERANAGAPPVIDTIVQTLGGAADAIALDQTITPQTLAALVAAREAREQSGARDTSRDTRVEPRRVGPHGLTLATLPRISLAVRANEPGGPRGSNAGVSGRVGTAGAVGHGDGDGDGDDAARADLEVFGLLGEGGMGRVHLARQRSLHRDVAIKTLKPEVDDASVAASLLGEAVITGLLEHPNIIPVHALGCDDAGRPLLVMKRVEGVSWRELLYDDAHPAWEHVSAARSAGDRLAAHLDVLMQVCNALHFAHSRGVVHRDVKPENVMIGDFGEVYLLDWGIAARLPVDETGGRTSLVGTPGYMAPEMVSLDVAALSARTDVYLLGATLHEVLTRRCRHEGPTLQAALLSAYTSEPVRYRDAVPAELAALANAATSADPESRPPSALAFRQALADYLRHRASLALSASAEERLAELRGLLAEAAADAGADGRVRQLMTECRFGFAQALREWEGNAAARAGLRATLETMAGHEIERGNADAARALLDELADAPAALRDRLAALEREIAARASKQRELEQLRHEMDYTIGARQRHWLMVTLGTVGLLISVLVAINTSRGTGRVQPTLGQVTRYGAVVAVIVWAGGVLGRKYLLRNAVGRGVYGVVALSVTAMLLHRGLSLVRGTPVPIVLADDQLILAAILSVAGVTLARPLLWGVPTLLLCALGTTLVPDRSSLFFTAGTILTVVIEGFAMRSLERGSRVAPVASEPDRTHTAEPR